MILFILINHPMLVVDSVNVLLHYLKKGDVFFNIIKQLFALNKKA